MADAAGDLEEFLADVNLASLSADGYTPYVRPEDCVLLMHIHVLNSSVPLIKQLLKNGFRPESIVIVPKVYSTIPAAASRIAQLGCGIVRTARDMFTPGQYDFYAVKGLNDGVRYARAACFKTKARRCIVVDDGGLLTERWSAAKETSDPFDAISVQQTSSGLYGNRQSALRRINVAGSAAKRFFESKIIVSGVMRKLSSLRMLSRSRNLAVIGIGTLGKRIAQTLSLQGHQVLTCDIKGNRELPNATHTSWQECVKNADIILGCTGRNFMHFEVSDLFSLQKRKMFVSLSSRDIEFKSFLLSDVHLSSDRPFSDLRVKSSNNFSHTVLNGGFPINFDRKIEWERFDEINVTRGLVLIAILQALCVPACHDMAKIEKLALQQQYKLVMKWLHNRDQAPGYFEVEHDQFHSLRWWSAESNGTDEGRSMGIKEPANAGSDLRKGYGAGAGP